MKNSRLEIRAKYEQGLCDVLDENIQEGSTASLAIAIKVLQVVKDTFSKYEEYMKRVNIVIGQEG